MLHKYKMTNLTCAHCAASIEREIGKWSDVASANLDLMSGKLLVESDTDDAALFARVQEVVKRIEPKAEATRAEKHSHGEACDCGHDHAHEHHEHAHGEACDCGHDHAHHEHAHGEACDCGHDHAHHEHAHGEACDCGHDHAHHEHAHGESCDCGHDHAHEHHEHAHGEACDCGHDHVHHEHTHTAAAIVQGGQRYRLEGLTCAHCASVIEREVASWADVEAASLDLMNATLMVKTEVAPNAMLARVREAVAAVEKNVTVTAFEGKKDAPGAQKPGLGQLLQSSKEDLVRIALAVLTVIGTFIAPEGPLETLLFVVAYLVVGLPVLVQATKAARGGFFFSEQMLMSVASLGAMLVGEYGEGVAVMLFYTVGEILQNIAITRSKRSIAALLDMRPDTVRVQRNGAWVEVDPESVAVGELIQVQPGERIALDGTVESGSASLDTSAVTGESRPFDVASGDAVQSGAVNSDGVLTIRVEKVYGDSTLARILSLVEDASAKKTETEKFITRFAHYYTPFVCALALLLAIVPPLVMGAEWSTWIYRGLTFLVVSCPCALIISVPLTYFAGIGGASRQHILVKGSQYLEALAKVEQVAFDKTGTLTAGAFHVSEVVLTEGHTREEVLQLAASLERFAAHPLAEALVGANEGTLLDVADYQNIAGQGVRGAIDGKTYYIGNKRLMKAQGIEIDEAKIPMGTSVLLAEEGKLLAMFGLEDEVKEGVREAIEELHKLGVHHTAMLSGDRDEVAQVLGTKLGLDEVHGNLLPEDKIKAVEGMMEGGGTLAFVGDGVNDAPVLARADIGIAMGGVGSDAALEAADVVLMSDHPRDVVRAIKLARRTRTIVYQNVIGALGFKAVLLVLSAVGLANMWMAVFADVGVSIICVINAMRAMQKVK